MRKFIAALALGLLFTTAAMAQSPKLGYISSTELLSLMPEVTKADNDLKAFAKTYEDQLTAMGKEFQTKLGDYQSKQKTMTEAMREVSEKELQQLQDRIESTQQSAQEKIAKKKEDLYRPILERADKAIKDVAVEKGYDYIFDASAGSLLYAKDADNILNLVKAKLGIK